MFGSIPGLWGIQALGPGLQQGSPSQGISLQLCQTLVGQFCNFCDIFTSAHLADRTKCGWTGILVLPLEVLHGYRMVQAQNLPLLRPGSFHCSGFLFIPGMPHDVCFITDNFSSLLSLESEEIVPRVKAFIYVPTSLNSLASSVLIIERQAM